MTDQEFKAEIERLGFAEVEISTFLVDEGFMVKRPFERTVFFVHPDPTKTQSKTFPASQKITLEQLLVELKQIVNS